VRWRSVAGMWMKRSDGDYINITTGVSMVASGSASSWTIKVGSNVELNAGTFPSQADAQDAIAKLTQGVDPAGLV
jgi:hypothetical protein